MTALATGHSSLTAYVRRCAILTGVTAVSDCTTLGFMIIFIDKAPIPLLATVYPVNLLVNVSCCIFSYRGGSEMVFPWKEKCCPSNGSNRNKSDSKQKSIVKTDATLDGNSSCKIINNEN